MPVLCNPSDSQTACWVRWESLRLLITNVMQAVGGKGAVQGKSQSERVIVTEQPSFLKDITAKPNLTSRMSVNREW